jgi:hypothetical protein
MLKGERMQEGIIEPLKGGLKKLFDKKIPKNDEK